MMIKLTGIHKSFASGFLMKRRSVLNGLELNVQAGHTYALLGANGAGKSTTIRILLGLSTADQGSGTLLGSPLGTVSVRRRLGYLPENPSFHEQLTPVEFLRYTGELIGLRGQSLRRRIDMLLARVELQDAANRRLRKLSKGMCQRLGLAQVLLGDPELLILDEPMSGLDPPGRKMVRDLITEQRKAGKTVLFSTHILSDAEAVCTRAGILRAGRLTKELDIDALANLQTGVVEIRCTGLSPAHIATLGRWGHKSSQQGTTLLLTAKGGESTQKLIRTIVGWGGDLLAVVPRHASLEEVYLSALQSPEAQTLESAPLADSKHQHVEEVG